MTLTNKQAVAIAEWMGLKKTMLAIPYMDDEYAEMWDLRKYKHSYPVSDNGLKLWLLSDSGEVAMMDRLENIGWWQWERNGSRFTFGYYQTIKGSFRHQGKPRREALVNAILEVIDVDA